MWNPFRRSPDLGHAEIRSAILQAQRTMTAQETTINELRQQLLLDGWRELGGEQDSFSRSDIRTMVRSTRGFAAKNVLVGRAIRLRGRYIFGAAGGRVEIPGGSEQQQAALAKFVTQPDNRGVIFGARGGALAQAELDLTGSLFVSCHARDRANRIIDPPQVRLVPFEEIVEVVSDPEDRAHPMFYVRQRQVGSRELEELHPALAHALDPRTKREPQINGKLVRWDIPIAHFRRGLPNGSSPWSIPIAWPSISWALAHTHFLSDAASVSKALAKVANQLVGKGASAAQVEAARKKLDTSLDTTAGQESNPRPAAGSTFVTSDQWEYKAMNIRGAGLDTKEAKAFRMQVAAAFDLPDHVLIGDVDQGSRATAEGLDRPTELAMLHEQRAWSEVYSTLATWALTAAGYRKDLPPVVTAWEPINEPDPAPRVSALLQAVAPGVIDPSMAENAEAIRRELLYRAGVEDPDGLLDGFDPDAEPHDTPDDAAEAQAMLAKIRAFRGA